MPYEDKPGEGTLFVNLSKHPRAPKLAGPITLPDGSKARIAMWPVTDKEGNKRTDKNNNPFWSMKLTLESDNYTRGKATPPADDDLPI